MIDSCLTSHSLVFPRWDAISILFSVFLLSYIYIESVSVATACRFRSHAADERDGCSRSGATTNEARF